MKSRLVVMVLSGSVSVLASAGLHAADEGKWMVRVRALDMLVDNDNSTTAVVPALGTVEVEDKWFPEIDFTYFFTPNWAAELILTYPQKHDVTFAGVNIGTIKHLPPTLTIQYHFLPQGTFRPYAGIGLNYTRFMDVDLNAAPALGGINAPLDVDDDSWGFAFQVGADYAIAPNWFVNLDAKYVQISADNIRISGGALAGTKVTDLDVDPWLLSIGLGYRF
jgi:outer membrane protein